MAVDNTFMVRKIQSKENLFAVFCAFTNSPLVVCDPETFNDQVWLFETEELLQGFAKPYMEEKKLLLKKLDDRIRETAQYDNIYTMGMRGLHDEAMKGSTDPKARARTLEKVFSRQREILTKYKKQKAERLATDIRSLQRDAGHLRCRSARTRRYHDSVARRQLRLYEARFECS